MQPFQIHPPPPNLVLMSVCPSPSLPASSPCPGPPLSIKAGAGPWWGCPRWLLLWRQCPALFLSPLLNTAGCLPTAPRCWETPPRSPLPFDLLDVSRAHLANCSSPPGAGSGTRRVAAALRSPWGMAASSCSPRPRLFLRLGGASHD